MSEKKKLLIVAIVFAVILVMSVVFINSKNEKITQEETNKENIEKVSKVIEVNQENFEEEVLKSDKKVLIDFYAIWCGPCKIAAPILEEVAEENDDIKVVEIDVDKSEQLVYKYNVSAMPTLVVIENGKEVNRSVGIMPKDKILELCGKTNW